MRDEDNNSNNNDNNKFKEETGKITSPNNGCFHVKSFVSGTDGPKLLGVKNHPHEISGTYDPCHTGENKHPYKHLRAKMTPGTNGPL